MRRLVLAAALLAACAAPPAAENPEPALLALVTTHLDALARGDRAAYESTYDHSRGAFALCMAYRFGLASRVGARNVPTTVARVEPYGEYLRAFVAEASGYRRYYFRRDADRWLITQPRREEVGEERARTVAGVTFSYWTIDEDVSEIVARDAANARDVALRYGVGAPRGQLRARLYPTRELASRVRCSTTGSAYTRDPSDPEVRLYDLWLAPQLDQLSAESQTVVRHEALHWLQDQLVEGAVQQADWWLVEGWPDYVAGVSRKEAFKAFACGPLPDFAQLASGPRADPDDAPDVVGRYYAYAYSAVQYLSERYGAGMYWSMLRGFRGARRAQEIYPEVLKLTPEGFRDDWVSWARATYCPR